MMYRKPEKKTSKNRNIKINYSGINTANASPNYSIIHEHERSKNSDNSQKRKHTLTTKFKRKLSAASGHTRNDTQTTLMERIMKSSQHKQKSKNKSKIKILNHLQKKILNMTGKSKEDNYEKNKTRKLNKTNPAFLVPSPNRIENMNTAPRKQSKGKLFYKMPKQKEPEHQPVKASSFHHRKSSFTIMKTGGLDRKGKIRKY